MQPETGGFGRFDFSGKVAVVTGGARGIGRATCDLLQSLGATVIVLDRQPERDGATESGAVAEQHEIDIADDASVDRTFSAIHGRHGRLDILVNNAAIVCRKPALEISAGEWRRVLDVNLSGTFACARAAARLMRPQTRGIIVNVASIGGYGGGGMYPNPAYRASKAGVINLTKTLAIEWAPFGIRVNGVAPSWVRTPLMSNVTEEPAMLAEVARRVPLGRLVEPEEVAAAIVFLASDAAAMITGHTLPVDGGILAR